MFSDLSMESKRVNFKCLRSLLPLSAGHPFLKCMYSLVLVLSLSRQAFLVLALLLQTSMGLPTYNS